MTLLKGNFQPKGEVKPEDKQPDAAEEFRKKAIESIGGSMVFCERNRLYYDAKKK